MRLALVPLARSAAAGGRATGRHRHGHHTAGPHTGRRPHYATITAWAACGSSTPSTGRSRPVARSRQLADHPTEFPAGRRRAWKCANWPCEPGQKLIVSVKAADLCDLGQGPNVAGQRAMAARRGHAGTIAGRCSNPGSWCCGNASSDDPGDDGDTRPVGAARRSDRRQRADQERRARPKRRPPPPRPASRATTSRTIRPPGNAMLRRLRVEGALTNCRKSTPEVLGLADVLRRHPQGIDQQSHRHRGTEEAAAKGHRRPAAPHRRGDDSRVGTPPGRAASRLGRRREESRVCAAGPKSRPTKSCWRCARCAIG